MDDTIKVGDTVHYIALNYFQCGLGCSNYDLVVTLMDHARLQAVCTACRRSFTSMKGFFVKVPTETIFI